MIALLASSLLAHSLLYASPATADWLTTEACVRAGTCHEGNLLMRDRTVRALSVPAEAVLLGALDRRLRGWQRWALRGVAYGVHGAMVVRTARGRKR